MKTILVLTDFSINADYTAHYALKLAQKIKANLLLCNIYTAPPEELRRDRKPWPLGIHEENSVEDLGAITARLKTQVDKGDEKDFRPEIDQYSKEGSITDTVNDIVSSHNILLAVISMHSSHPLTSLFSVNHEWNIIKIAQFPLLVIPYQVRFKDYKTIAFATDLTATDADVLNSLAGLAKYSDAGILIAHVANNNATVKEGEDTIKQFFRQLPLQLNYLGISFRAIKNNSVTIGLKELAQDVTIDMLVLVKRKHNFFQKIFEKNVIRKLSGHPAKPLLIFPNTNILEKLPVF
jgi:nucleotide-binding universal stress UspA family protein